MMNWNSVVGVVSLLLLASACGPNVRIGNRTYKAETVCSGHENCGVSGKRQHVDGKAPLVLNYKEGVPGILGNVLGYDVYGDVEPCGELLSSAAIEDAKAVSYDFNIGYTGDQKSELEAALVASAEGTLGIAEGDAGLKAVFNRTVKELTKGKYTSTIQTYTLGTAATVERKKACASAIDGGGEMIKSVAVFSVEGATITDQVKSLLASLEVEAKAEGTVKAVAFDGDGSLKAELKDNVKSVIESVLGKQLQVIVIGRTKF